MIGRIMNSTNEPLMNELKAITDYLDSIDPQWRSKVKGASGTMTPSDDHGHEDDLYEWIVPKGTYANVRDEARLEANLIYQLPQNQSRLILGKKASLDIDGKTWYRVAEGYVREDVVTVSLDKPAPIAPVMTPAKWPAPVSDYTITNHDGHMHDGLDFACEFGTPIAAGPHGGFVVKAFTCTVCNSRSGDGKASLQDPGKAYGYGSHVIVRYAYETLPQTVKTAIPNGAYLYAIHAHLSRVLVKQGDVLRPNQVIGEVGASGNTYSIGGGSPSHLHYSLRWSAHPDAAWNNMHNNRVNPNLLVKA